MRRVKPQAFPEDPLVSEATVIANFIRASRTQSGMTLEEAALTIGLRQFEYLMTEFRRVGRSRFGHGGLLVPEGWGVHGKGATSTHPHQVAFATVLKVAKELGVSVFAVPANQRESVRKMIKNQQLAVLPLSCSLAATTPPDAS